MKTKTRIITCVILALGCAFLFAFEPEFNIQGQHGLSLYTQYFATDIGFFLQRITILTLFVFVSLLFLFGTSPKKEQEPSKQDKPSEKKS